MNENQSSVPSPAASALLCPVLGLGHHRFTTLTGRCDFCHKTPNEINEAAKQPAISAESKPCHCGNAECISRSLREGYYCVRIDSARAKDRATIERLTAEIQKEQASHLRTVDERDEAQEAVSQAYYLLIGHGAEWSNEFGYKQALEDIDDAQRLLRETVARLTSGGHSIRMSAATVAEMASLRADKQRLESELAEVTAKGQFARTSGLGVLSTLNAMEQERDTLREQLAAVTKERDGLYSAIKTHHNQRADDRCWFDDADLYKAAGFETADFQVGDQDAMLKNCARFIANRTIHGGAWKSYAELEQQLATATARAERLAAALEFELAVSRVDDRCDNGAYRSLRTRQIEIALAEEKA